MRDDSKSHLVVVLLLILSLVLSIEKISLRTIALFVIDMYKQIVEYSTQTPAHFQDNDIMAFSSKSRYS